MPKPLAIGERYRLPEDLGDLVITFNEDVPPGARMSVFEDFIKRFPRAKAKFVKGLCAQIYVPEAELKDVNFALHHLQQILRAHGHIFKASQNFKKALDSSLRFPDEWEEVQVFFPDSMTVAFRENIYNIFAEWLKIKEVTFRGRSLYRLSPFDPQSASFSLQKIPFSTDVLPDPESPEAFHLRVQIEVAVAIRRCAAEILLAGICTRLMSRQQGMELFLKS